MFDLNTLKFDEKGLIPAVVVDALSKKVLTVAYMNRESLEISMKEGKPASGPVPVRNCGEKEKLPAISSTLSASLPTVTEMP